MTEGDWVPPVSESHESLTRSEVVGADLVVIDGTSVQSALKGAFARFLPAGVLLTVPIGIWLGTPWGELLLGVSLFELCLMIGYAVGLLLLRERLRHDAGLEGRRSVVAGLVAPFALFIVVAFLGGTDQLGAILSAIATGCGTALLMFFPWLRGRDEHEDTDARQLPTGSAF